MLTHELTHLILSLLAGGIIYFFCRRWYVFLVALISGFFVDADHLFDYFLFKKELVFNLSEFLQGSFFKIAGKVFVPFHGFEYALIAIIIGMILLFLDQTKRKLTFAFLCLVFGISLSAHLLLDTFTYKPKLPAYFITFRIISNFDHNKLGFH